MSLWAGFTLYVSHDSYTFIPNKSEPGRQAKKLIIDRPVVIGEEVPKYEKQFIVHGILGMITLHTCDFLVVITNRKRVTSILDSTIYLATDFRLLPVLSDANPAMLSHPIEKRLIALVKESLYSGPLYFSYEFDLTSNMQRQIQQSAGKLDSDFPLWKRADERFFWNIHLQERLMTHAATHPEEEVSPFIMPVMFGFLEVKLAQVANRSFVLGLISRRSRHRAGTRYFSRGVDAKGNVANFNETEQFILMDPPSFHQPHDVEDVEGLIRMSFVQTRGSVPVYWAEINNLRYKPDLLIPDNMHTQSAFEKHMTNQVSYYGKNYLVNLVNQKGYEKPVKEAYENAITRLDHPLVNYTYFDFHHECKGMKFDRVSLLVNHLVKQGLSSHDFFSLDTTGDPRLRLQKSTVRTNCMDCLDRTNVVQTTLARWVLNDQLRSVGVLKQDDSVENYPKFMYLFRNIWADHADVISKAYSGTGALKTDFTRTGKRTTEGILQDGVNSLTRYVKNNFFDGKRQDAYDLITGAWDPKTCVPREDTRAWNVRLMPWIMYLSLFFLLASLFLPSSNSARPYRLEVGFVPVFSIIWVLVALFSFCFIWQHGMQYVGWPKLNRPEELMYYISGEAPKEPVVCKSNGFLYEKRLIEQYVEEHGKDPVTNEPLSLDDILPVKSSPRTAFPRPPTHSSVPSLLMALQNEYDAIVFETLELRKQYDTVRQDLANALYTNDASMRVIARLMKERDEAREALSSVHTSLGMPSSSGAHEDVEMTQAANHTMNSVTSLPVSVMEQIDSKAAALTKDRRARIKRGGSEGYPTPASAASLQAQSPIPSEHHASSPGIAAIDTSADGALVLTGGKDTSVHVLDRTANKAVAKLEGHAKPVTSVVFSGRSNPAAGDSAKEAPSPLYAASASDDGTVRIWRSNDKGQYELAHTIASTGVTGLSVHPTESLLGSASRDGSWSIYSLETGECLLHVPAANATDEQGAGFVFESFAFHPDGQLAATGTSDGVIRIWDVKQGQQSAVFRGHEGAVHTLDFSQNGYLLAAASRGAKHVKIWDLRKLEVTRMVDTDAAIEEVRFDPTAQLLAVVTAMNVRVFGGKSLELCATLDVNNGLCAQWCPNDGALLIGAQDGNVCVVSL